MLPLASQPITEWLAYAFGLAAIAGVFFQTSEKGSIARVVSAFVLIGAAICATLVIAGMLLARIPHEQTAGAEASAEPPAEGRLMTPRPAPPIQQRERTPLPSPDVDVWLQPLDVVGPNANKGFFSRSPIQQQSSAIFGWCWTLLMNRTGRKITIDREDAGWTPTVFNEDPSEVYPIEWKSSSPKIRTFLDNTLRDQAVSREWELKYLRVRHYPLKRSELLQIPTYELVLGPGGHLEVVQTSCPPGYAAPK